MTPTFALEATCLADPRPTGIARYARELVLALDALPTQEDFQLVLLYRSSRWKRRRQLPTGARLRSQMWRNNLWPLRRPYDLVHATDHRLPHWRGPAMVSTIFDIYALLGLNFENASDRQRQIGIYRDLGRRSHHLLFISEHSRRDFLEHVGFDPTRAHVTHLGVGSDFRPHAESELTPLRARYGLDRPYFLFVGLTNPNKNLPRLLTAFARSDARREHLLVLAGKVPDEEAPRLAERIATLGLKDRVRLTGYLPDEDLPKLYAGAAAFLLPSLYEGFGLPILEAMASGTPVLTSTTSSCPEVAAGHAVLVDPEDEAALAQGLVDVLSVHAQARAAARAYAATKTWQATALATLAAYRTAVADRSHD